MDSQLSELRDHVIDLRTRVGEHISGKHSNTLQQVDHKLVEILNLLQDADQYDIPKRQTDGQAPRTTQDDLTLIQGISDELAKSLYSSNVSQFQTIADWTSDDVCHFSKLLSIGFQIQKQNWIEQAKILSVGHDTSFSRKAKQDYKLVVAPLQDSPPKVNQILKGKLTEKLPVPDSRATDSASGILDDQDMSPILEFPETHKEELSAPPAVGRVQNFFRPSNTYPESVRISETAEETQDNNEKIWSATHKKEEPVFKTETTSSADQIGSDTGSDQSTDITNEEKEPDTLELESRQNPQKSSAPRRTTFPDFRLFTNSTLSDNSSDSERSDESRGSGQKSRTSDDRGAVRRFFRAITKSEKS